MAAFITYFTYTQQAMAALIKNSEDRSKPLIALVEDAPGGTVHGVYLEAGSNNGFALYDLPQAGDVTMATMVVNVPGHVTNLGTVPLVAIQDLVPLAGKATAIAYRAPG